MKTLEILNINSGSRKRGKTKNQVEKTQDESLQSCAFPAFRVGGRGYGGFAETGVDVGSTNNQAMGFSRATAQPH